MNVFSGPEEAERVRKCGIGRCTIGLSWVYERAIPHVALERLIDGDLGVVSFDEEVQVNKVKHRDNRES